MTVRPSLIPRPAPAALPGMWRGTVIAVADDNLVVESPRLLPDRRLERCETAVFDPPLEVGDRVWVSPIEGSRDEIVVIARRA